jgi:hypothetical protein
LHWENACNRKPIVFDVHPNELINENDGNQRTIKRRTPNLFSFLINDWLRGILKIRNLGSSAIPILRRELKFFSEKGYRFITMKDYAQEIRFLE